MTDNQVFFVKPYQDHYIDLSNYLKLYRISCFELVLYKQKKRVSIKSKGQHLISFIYESCKILPFIKKARHSNQIISTGYITLTYLLLRKFGILKKCVPIAWYGFFLHSDTAIKVFKFLLSKLLNDGDKIIVFSQYEVHLYSNRMSLHGNVFHNVSLPLRKSGHFVYEFNNIIDVEGLPTDFYFSGGYTNRDFLTLIKIFKILQKNIVICCSSLNTEINNLQLPNNIILLKDVREDCFIKIMRKSKCVIALMKNNNGASGQMLVLEAMTQKKVVIASRTNVIEELITHRVTGFTVNNVFKELPEIIELIESKKIDINAIGENASKKINTEYSEENYSRQLNAVLQLCSGDDIAI